MAANYVALLAAAKAQWGQLGDISAVLTVLLTSPEFTGATERWKKVKSPLHVTASLARCFVASPDWGAGIIPTTPLTLLIPTLFVEIMGQPLFAFETPDGFPMSNSEQMAVSGFADRALSAERQFPDAGDPGWELWLSHQVVGDFLFDPAAAVMHPTWGMGSGQGSAPAVAQWLLRLVYGDRPLQPNEALRIEQELLLPGPLPTPGTVPYAHHVRIACELLGSLTYFSLY
jgi:hypothetical protein